MSQPTTPTLWIHGLGVTSPLGDTAAATAAAVRAGISRRRQGARRNRQGQPMIVASLPDEALPPPAADLSASTDHARRLLRIATHAAREASAAANAASPLLLALPEPHPDLPDLESQHFLADLQRQSGVPLDLARSALAAGGRAGALAALADAHALLGDPALSCVLVGGVDSLLEPSLLAALDRARRVHAVGVRDGFAPGEGAGFLLLSRRRELPGSRARCRVTLPGVADEPGHLYDPDEPHRGDGLAAAIAAATRGCESAAIRTVLAGLNGEHYFAREWGVAALRNAEKFAADLRLEHPVDCLGDPGAALGPTLVALAATALVKGYHAGPSLVWCASDGALRAAAIVELIGDP
jgi:3-oxoacyl-[acyl-carrier-protein] synthase-1